MNVRDMHIEVRQSLSQVGANRNRKYQSEELDWVLNKMQGRFIETSIKSRPDGSGGFELDQQNVDRIRTLIVSAQNLVPYIDAGKGRYKCYLPHNYLYLLSDWSVSKELCGETATKSQKVLFVNALKQIRSTKSSAPFYVTQSIALKGTSFTFPGSLNEGHSYTGYPRKEDSSFFEPYVALRSNWYWEKAGDLYYPGQYVSLSESIGTGTPLMTVDGTIHTPAVSSTTIQYYIHTNSDGTENANRLLPTNKVKEFARTAFYKSQWYAPISELVENILYVYNDSSFIVSGVGISYIRKPQPISLSLNTSCELPTQSCQKICDLAVEYIKGRNENAPGQQLIERDNQQRVIL